MTQTVSARGLAGRDDPAAFASTAHDSLRVAVWTAVSRATGFVRVIVVAAVLGPTFLGNTYQFTNSLPNLVYYGLLGGALVSSLLVPALVRHVGTEDPAAAGRIAGGFLGVALAASAVAILVALDVGPRLLQATLSADSPEVARAQMHAATWLLLLVMPQAACYAVVATSAAVMNAHGRFALAAAAPALENIGTLAVMAAAALRYGTGREVTGAPIGMLLLLGGGTTGAVALHALVQWLGARRAGTTVRPSAGWRDAEVRAVVRLAATALLQAGLWSLQLLVLSALANRVRGGVVAIQIAMNFFFLPVAVGAAPVAIALQPRLARLHQAGRGRDQADAFLRGIALTLFVTVPAAAAYLVLAPGLADLVALGRMSGHGTALVAVSLRAVAVGVVGTGVFTVATYACYARGDTRRPVRLMMGQTAVALSVMAASGVVHGTAALAVLGSGLSAASVLSAALLVRSLRAALPAGSTRLRQFFPRLGLSTVAMTVSAWSIVQVGGRLSPGRRGSALGTLAAVVVGGAVYLCVQRSLHAPEIAWLRGRAGDGEAAPAAPGCAMTSYSPVQRRRSYDVSLRRDAVRRATARTLMVLGALLAGVGAGLLPLEAAALGVAIVLAVAVWRRPALGAYLVIGLTPLTAGIDRGTLIPVLRPNEALVALVGGVLFARWLFGLGTMQGVRMRIDTVLGSILVLAVTSSAVPLIWLALRNEPITSDDLLYALVIWKYLGVFLLVRSAVRTEAEIRRCLLISIAAAVLVSAVAILQSLGVGAVISALSHYYITNGNVDALSNSRGSSTLTLPIAVADLMVFNLAIVVGMWLYARLQPVLVLGAACMIVAGTLAAAEFSGVLGLAVGVVVLLVATRSVKLTKLTGPGLVMAVLVLWPVIHVRLLGFQSTSGLPVSWTARLFNLRNYFWPVLRAGNNYLLGVRPAARIPAPHRANGFIWIESGYTWLLWAGGIPLLLAFVFFVVTCSRVAWSAARYDSGVQRVAGLATVTALAVMTVLMAFDPHLTYRGSADALFALIALTVVRPRAQPARPDLQMPIPSARPEVVHVHV